MKGGKVEAIAAPEDSDSDSDSDSDDETTKKIKGAIVEISDAELFKRCGGLTGHKGTVTTMDRRTVRVLSVLSIDIF